MHCICTNTNTAELFLQVGKFPLTGKNSLYILVPPTPSEKDFLLMEKNINYKTIDEMVSEMNKMPIQTAEVTLPIIKLTETTLLEDLLRNLGKNVALFTPKCWSWNVKILSSVTHLHVIPNLSVGDIFTNIAFYFPYNKNIINIKLCTTG